MRGGDPARFPWARDVARRRRENMSKRLHAAAMTVILGLMPTAPVSTAVAADCSGYSLEGIRPGMEAREVWKAMGGKGYERNREAGP